MQITIASTISRHISPRARSSRSDIHAHGLARLVVTSQTKCSADFIALLERLDHIHGPKPGAACKPVTIVLDNGPIHTSKATRAALAERKHWLTPERLAKYAPELNDIERDWKTLKAQHLAYKTFRNRDDLKIAIDADIQAINSTRKLHPLANQRISA